MTAFGMTKRPGRSVSNDPGLQAVLASRANAICLVSKAWDYHVRVALGITNEENLEALDQSVKAIVKSGREAMIDCEHFFDGYKGNQDYAIAMARTAFDAGARWVVLCDTNGGTLPHEVEGIVGEVAQGGPRRPARHPYPQRHRATPSPTRCLAVRAGCRQIQGTLNGIGERCGNANFTSIIPTLLLKGEFANHFETKVTPERLRTLTHASRVLDEVLNRALRPARALCRRERLCDQGRHPRLRHRQGAGNLRARRARKRRQSAPPARLQAGRQVEHPCLYRAPRYRGREG